MKRSVYIKPTTNIVVLHIESDLLVNSVSSTKPVEGLTDGFTFGGQSDGSKEINAKKNDGLWGFDDE